LGRDPERTKFVDDNDVAADDVDDVSEAGGRWVDFDAASSSVRELPLLRQFICRFTEARVREELTERRRQRRNLPPPRSSPSSPPSSSFPPRREFVAAASAAARIRVPSYRGAGGLRGGSHAADASRPPLASGRVEKILRSIIVRTISEKLCPPLPRRRSTWLDVRPDPDRQLHGAGLSLADVAREPVGHVTTDSRSSSSDDGASGWAPAAADDLQTGGRGPPGRKTRPKRGHYRKYNRQLLLDAVCAVRKGDMSVHRAGSYYGVPHSTLEYKVKERHLLRHRKTEPSAAGPAGCPVRSRRRGHPDDPGPHPRASRDPAVAELDTAGTGFVVDSAAETYLAQLRCAGGRWPYSRSLADAAVVEDPLPPWQKLFHHHRDPSGLSAASPATLQLPPPPPILPFDLGRTLPVGFGWPPPPPLLSGMFPFRSGGSAPAGGVDAGRLPPVMAGGGVHPFSMSASDLLKSFQQKAAASGAGSDIRDMADDRLMSLFPVLGGVQYDAAGYADDGGSPSQVAVG